MPSQTQRVLMLLAVLSGMPAWWWAAGWVRPADGLSGWSLGDVGWMGVLVLVVAGLPAVLAGAAVSAAGNPLSGVWCAAVSGAV
ncbi:MAG: hypothetical protein AAFX76_14275, partial [Planctomycetota bacterium]